MIESEGVVVKVEGDIAYVQAQRQSSCSGCSKGEESCGTSALLGILEKKIPLYRARNQFGVKVGDRVVIGVTEGIFQKGVTAIYLPPLLLLLAGAIGGSMLASTSAASENYSMIGALAGLSAGFLWSRYFSARMGAGGRYQPVVLSRVFEGDVVNFHGGSHRKC
jgi:sigma-E factor negative regulatory protein RseC